MHSQGAPWGYPTPEVRNDAASIDRLEMPLLTDWNACTYNCRRGWRGRVKRMNFALKTRKFAFKMLNLEFKMLNFVLKLMNFALKSRSFVFKMLNSAGGRGVERGRCALPELRAC